MYIYQAYGLGIHSEFELFQFPMVDARQDVVIRRDCVAFDGDDEELSYPYVRLTPQESVLLFEDVARILVQQGSEIVVDPLPAANQSLLKRFLLGAAMAILLYQRGRLVLHGSGVCINNQGVLILGGPGAGKSSLVAAHVSHGHQFLVDDIASIDFDGGLAWIYPGFPQVKLGYDVADLIASNATQFVSMDDLEDKKNFRVNYELCLGKVPLKQIYVLMGDGQTTIERINRQQAIIELIRYSIPLSLIKLTPTPHFMKCFRLAQCVEFYGLRRSGSLNDLSRLVNSIEANVDISHKDNSQE